MERCPYCGSQSVREYDDRCPACNEHVGFPNVRRAARDTERQALEERYRQAAERAAGNGSQHVLKAFETAAEGAQAVMCRTLSEACRVLESEHQMFVSFYRQVESGGRRPEATTADRDRALADDRLFPHYKESVCFAALSLDGLGPAHYGPCSITLKERTVAQRTSVVERNSLDLVRDASFGEVQPGYRAPWDRRAALAVAKLQPRISAATGPAEFPAVLLGPRPGMDDEDFVEAHIFGSIHRDSVERVRVRTAGLDSAARVLAKKLIRTAGGLPGVTAEEVE